MNDYDAETLINRIISGYQYITVKDSVYKLLSPSIHLKVAADILYKKYYQENLFDGFILKEDILDILISTEVVDHGFENDIKRSEDRLEQAKIDLYKNFFTKSKNRHKNTILSLNKVLNEAYVKKHSLDFLTLEHYCENLKNEYIISKTLYDDNDELVFKDYPDIDYTLFNSITSAIAFNIISVPDFKKLARSDKWRKIYSNNQKVFPGAASEYTEEQKAILSVSKMYEKIYEHPDCPDEAIFEDDDALDGWMLEKQRENQRQKQQKGVDKSLGKAAGAGEVFVMTGNKKENIENITRMNTGEAAAKASKRTNLKEGQSLDDTYFSDTQQQLRQEIAKLNKRKK